jgi:hypothetical protein
LIVPSPAYFLTVIMRNALNHSSTVTIFAKLF